MPGFKDGFKVKKADAVRLTAAYLLVAFSGRDCGNPGSKSEAGRSRRRSEPSGRSGPWLVRHGSKSLDADRKKPGRGRCGRTYVLRYSGDFSCDHCVGLYLRPLRRSDRHPKSAGAFVRNAPEGAISVIGDRLQRIAAQSGGTLGFAFILGLALAFWSANAGVKALFDALNVL